MSRYTRTGCDTGSEKSAGNVAVRNLPTASVKTKSIHMRLRPNSDYATGPKSK